MLSFFIFEQFKVVMKKINILFLIRVVLSCYSELLHNMFMGLEAEPGDFPEYHLILPDYSKGQVTQILQVWHQYLNISW